jgi:serine/threonine protein kinase
VQDSYGEYKVVDKIGEGAMGEVFLVEDPHGKKWALKALLPKFLESSSASSSRQRFHREMNLSLEMSDPNIINVKECHLEEESPYMIMDFAEGGSLSKYLKEKGTLRVSQGMTLALQMASALVTIHGKGIIHRDIKPGNILLDGEVFKMSDLGLARLGQRGVEAIEEELTMTHSVLGSPYYMAPEQALNPKAADIRSDIYSLGATLYHALTGQRPHEGQSSLEVMMMHSNASIRDIRELNKDIPTNFAFVIMKMLERTPVKRYQVPSEMLSDLEKIRDLDLSVESLKSLSPKEGNKTGFIMFSCFVFLVVAGLFSFLKISCLPPTSGDPLYVKARQNIKSLETDATIESFVVKIKAVEDFLEEFPRDEKKSDIQVALKLAKLFIQKNKYTVSLLKAGTFVEAREFEIKVKLSEKELVFGSSGIKTAIYPNQRESFEWVLGEGISFEVTEFAWINETIFSGQFGKKLPLYILMGTNKISINQEYKGYVEGEVFEMDFTIEDISRKDWQLFEDYIFPGSKW